MGKAVWSIPALKEHFEALLRDMDIRGQQRFDASEKALAAALLAQERAVQTAMIAAEKATTKAEVSTEQRLGLLNELRAEVATTGQLAALEKVVSAMADRMNRAEGRGLGMASLWGYLVGVAGVALAAWAVLK